MTRTPGRRRRTDLPCHWAMCRRQAGPARPQRPHHDAPPTPFPFPRFTRVCQEELSLLELATLLLAGRAAVLCAVRQQPPAVREGPQPRPQPIGPATLPRC